jgi:ABC-type uncharacterized transport system involved in gliding motility auxiliary subunit
MSSKNRFSEAGLIGVSTLRLLLLAFVLGEIAFLASRYALRVDLTSDKIYTLTDSTKTVLNSLQDNVVIEAYFSPDQSLPIGYRPARVMMRNALMEYVELSQGKINLQYFDPFADRTVRETAERLGIRPEQARTSSSGQLTATEIWQGFRIRYGAEKQEVIPLLPFGSTYTYEAVLTPLIKRLTVQNAPKIGVLAFRSQPGSSGMVIGGGPKSKPQSFVEVLRAFSRDYDFRPLDLSKGQLIPPELEVAILIRPKNLTDRMKFAFDQFLMRGGKLVVFADSAEVEVRQNREFRGKVPSYDGPASKVQFLEQLRSYGVVVEDRIVGEGIRQLHQRFGTPTQDKQLYQFVYPYMFEPANEDWSKKADLFARDQQGNVDTALSSQFAKLFKPGVNLNHDLMKAVASVAVPGFFWPCPVGVAEGLPDGVSGEVLLRTSPLSWKEMSKVELDPFTGAVDMQQRMRNLERWQISKTNMMPTRNPVQTPLMVHAKGTFSSYFKGREIPAKPAVKTANKTVEDPDDWGDEDKKQGQEGPDPSKKVAKEAAKESLLEQAPKSASLLVVGDATFIRDDFIRGDYADIHQANGVVGPSGRNGGSAALVFFRNLLDWLVQERDLLGLQNKVGANRAMTFLEQDEAQGETPEEFQQRLASRTRWISMLNAMAPASVFLGLGLWLWLLRRGRKRAFLNQW